MIVYEMTPEDGRSQERDHNLTHVLMQLDEVARAIDVIDGQIVQYFGIYVTRLDPTTKAAANNQQVHVNYLAEFIQEADLALRAIRTSSLDSRTWPMYEFIKAAFAGRLQIWHEENERAASMRAAIDARGERDVSSRLEKFSQN
jgi:hypothetical protein